MSRKKIEAHPCYFLYEMLVSTENKKKKFKQNGIIKMKVTVRESEDVLKTCDSYANLLDKA